MRKIYLLLLCAVMGLAQVHSVQILKGPALPSTCTVGQMFFVTSGATGLYQCTSTNGWTASAASDGSGGGGTQAKPNQQGEIDNLKAKLKEWGITDL